MTDNVRFRTDFKEKPNLYRWYLDGVEQPQEPFMDWDYYHWMADQINRYSKEKGRRPPGYCQHLKVDKTYRAVDISWVNGTTPVREINPSYWSAWPTPGRKPQSPTGSPTNPDDFGYSNFMGDFTHTPRFSDLCLEAWNKLKTQIPTEVSILNFIYELKDFKELGKSLSKVPKNISGRKATPFVTALKGKGKLRKGAKAVNDTFLSYNFQWAPFFGDLQKLTQLASKVAAKLDFLRKTRGKEVTIRFQKPDCFINDQLNVFVEKTGNAGWKREFVLDKYQCDFIVTAKLYQNLEGLDDAWASLRATFAALGINNPIKAAWNAIPFSFLLDWIGPFGKWLERAAVQPFAGTWDVYEITTSVRERGEIEFYLTGRPTYPIYFPKTLMERVKVDRYIRLIGLPQTLGAIDFSQLTQQQQKLFLSLVLTKVL